MHSELSPLYGSPFPSDDILPVKLRFLEDEEKGCVQPFTHYWTYCANETQRHAFTAWYRDRYLPVQRLLHPQKNEQYERGKAALHRRLKEQWTDT